MNDSIIWLWPQWFIIVWFLLAVILSMCLHGTAAEVNGGTTLLRTIVLFLVLIAGGFFG